MSANLDPGVIDTLDRRLDRALDVLMHNRDRLMDVIATLDTDELYYRLTGELRSNVFDAMGVDTIERYAGTDR